MPSQYFNNYQTAVESTLVEDLYNEAIYIMGFSGYYIPNTNSQGRDLLYGDDPLKQFTESYKMDTYLVNSMDYGDEHDFFTKFGLEVKNSVKVQIAVKEFNKKTGNKFKRPLEGDLIYVPFMKNTGELFEITFVNTAKDLYTLGRTKPYFYELSLEPFKYNDEVLDTGVTQIDKIDDSFAYKTDLVFGSGTGNYSLHEPVYQGANIAYASSTAVVHDWDSANLTLTVIHTNGKFSTTSNVIGAISNSQYIITNQQLDNQNTPYDNKVIKDEISSLISNINDENPFGSLSSSEF